MALDKRLPAVYVTIEDQSYMSTTLEAGRTAFCCLISDRGPHNRVVELNSRQDLYDLFGQPNFTKYGQGHYFIDQHLKRSGKVFVVRPVILEPIGKMTTGQCCSIANISLRMNNLEEHSEDLNGNFQIEENTNILQLTDPEDTAEIKPKIEFNVFGNTLMEGDILEFTFNSVPEKKVFDNELITNISTPTGYVLDSSHGFTQNCGVLTYDNTTKILTLTLPTLTDIVTNESLTILPRGSGTLLIGSLSQTTVANDTITYTINDTEVSLNDEILGVEVDINGTGSFTPWTFTIDSTNLPHIKSVSGYTDSANSIKVTAAQNSGVLVIQGTGPSTCFKASSVGDGIATGYKNRPDPLVLTGSYIPGVPVIPGMEPGSFDDLLVGDFIYPEDDPSTLYEIQEIDGDEVTFTPNVPVDGSYRGPFKKFQSVTMTTIPRMINEQNIDPLNEYIYWNFYVIGAGSYYNSIFIKGVRNSTYDKMYTDDDGNPEYPYAFMDIAIYRDNGDNTTTLLEGPWTVSLMDRTSKDVIIKDIYTGLPLYIADVINRKSKIVKVVESRGYDKLTTMNVNVPYNPDTEKRMILQNLISGKYEQYPNGIQFQNGSDGEMFDSMGRVNFNDNLKAILCQAYNGSLKSTDGSIEKLLSVVYPWYQIDYIYCGGWDHDVNHAALELAEIRQDCLLLADTGAYKESHDEEMEARQTLVPWNTWNAALYTNYREIYDEFTAKYFYISPIFHAIDRHLYCDDVYWVSEPVAGIEKGAIEESITLAYGTNETQLADEIDVELNPVIVETDGTYILQQFTTWKRLSVMKRQHVVKFVQYCKKNIPTILKDILHHKATQFWIKQADSRIKSFMNPFLDTGSNERMASISSYSTQTTFSDETSELTVLLTIKPLRSIEKITVNIIVT